MVPKLINWLHPIALNRSESTNGSDVMRDFIGRFHKRFFYLRLRHTSTSQTNQLNEIWEILILRLELSEQVMKFH